jgi:hypothetical protein
MTHNTSTTEVNAGTTTVVDLTELEFTPLTPEEANYIGDRDYLLGVHNDMAVR